MPGDRIPHSALPPAEMGTALQLNTMLQLTWTEADFLMHCIEVFADGDEKVTFKSVDGEEIALTTQQIDDLFLRIQDIRFHILEMEYERRMAMAD